MAYYTKQELKFKELLESAEEGYRLVNPDLHRTIKIDIRTPYRYHMIKGGDEGGGMLAGITDDVYEAIKFVTGG